LFAECNSGERTRLACWDAVAGGGHHRYILDLLKRMVRVSIETMKIVNALPRK
jgi:hypothetical protein